ncbi:MAG: DegT/DnrJ/EryC1/StrS family aminotransferase [Armatimonadota bacterium]
MHGQLALLGGDPIGTKSAPQHPKFTPDAIHSATHLLEIGETVGLGRTHSSIVNAEAAISNYHDGRHSLALGSGTAAIQAALMGLGFGPGDEIICPPYTWGGTVSPILACGCIPVFSDIDPITGNMDPSSLEAVITPRTKAIMVVHLYGQPADMPAINAIATKHGLKVIEDGSQAHGAKINGTVVGNFSDVSAFSCMGWKLLGLAEAGYMTTSDEDVFWRAAMTCQHYGRAGEPDFPKHYEQYVDSLVVTFRLSPVIAALFPSQLEKLDREIDGRRQNVDVLRPMLSGLTLAKLPEYEPGIEPSFHIVNLNFNLDDAGISRDTYCKALNAEGLEIGPYVPTPIYQWKRLLWQEYDGPEVWWQRILRDYGADYRGIVRPGTEHKIARDLLIGWNYTVPDQGAMERIAAIFHKVEDNIGALRDWEHGTESDVTVAAVKAARRAVALHKEQK